MVKFLSEEFSDGNENMFDYSKFYGKDSDYKNNIIRTFSENFLNKTIELISEVLGTEGNVGNWVRRSGSQKEFISKLNEKIALGTEFQEMYINFVNDFKTVKID